jgi:hypothetical protein
MKLRQSVYRVRGVYQRIIQRVELMNRLVLHLVIIGLGTGLVMFLLSYLSPSISWLKIFEKFEYKTCDWRFGVTRANTKVKSDIMVALVKKEDKEILLRGKYSQLVKDYGCDPNPNARAKAIGFDLVIYDEYRATEKEREDMLFEIADLESVTGFSNKLNERIVPDGLREKFWKEKRIRLPRMAVSVIDTGQRWKIANEYVDRTFTIKKVENKLQILASIHQIKEINKDLLAQYSKLCGVVYFAFAKRSQEQEYTIDEHEEGIKALGAETEWKEIASPEVRGKLVLLKTSFILPPLAQFSKAAKGVGHAHTEREGTEVLRKVPLLIRDENKCAYPEIGLQIACGYLGIDLTNKNNVKVKLGKHIKLTKEGKTIVKIPIDRDGYMYINYVGKFDKFRSFPLEVVLHEEHKMRPRKSEIILIGAEKTSKIQIGVDENGKPILKDDPVDCHETPFGDYPGVGIVANVADNILQKDFLHPKGLWSAVMLFALGLAIGKAGTSRPFLRVFLFFVILMAYVGLAFLWFAAHRWIELAVPFVVVPVVMAGYVCHDLFHVEPSKIKRPLLVWGVGIVVIGMFIFSIVMTLVLDRSSFGSAIIGLIAPIVGVASGLAASLRSKAPGPDGNTSDGH